MALWQHEETGRFQSSDDLPGQGWAKVFNHFGAAEQLNLIYHGTSERHHRELYEEVRDWLTEMFPPPWWRCRTHGDQPQNTWGCPKCVEDLASLLKAAGSLQSEIRDFQKNHAAAMPYFQHMAQFNRAIDSFVENETSPRTST